MKQLKLFFFVLFIFLSTQISALQLNSEAIFTQEYNEYKNITITIENIDSESIEDLDWQLNIPLDFEPIIYNQFEYIDATSSRSFLLSLKMSEWAKTGENKIGDIKINDLVIPVYTKIDSMLEIDDMKISRNSLSSNRIDTGDILEVRADDTVDFELRAENLFSDETFDDVIVSLYIRDLFGTTEKIESNPIRISEKRTETLRLSFQIPKNAIDKRYTVDVVVSGFSRESGIHEVTDMFYLDLRRSDYEFELTSTLSPNPLKCNEKDFRLYLKVVNLGSRNAQDLRLKAQSNQLNINFEEEFSLRNDFDKFEKRLTGSLNENTKGKYPIKVELYNSGSLIDSEIINLEFLGCEVEEINESKFEIIYTNIQKSNETKDSLEVVDKIELSTFDMIFITNIGVIILVSVSLLIVFSIKKKK